MAKFIVDLTPEHRAALEAYRAARGLKSESAAVRDLIERYSPGAVEAKQEAFIERVEAGIAQGGRGVRRARQEIEDGARPTKGRFTLDDVRPKIEPGSRLKKPKGTK